MQYNIVFLYQNFGQELVVRLHQTIPAVCSACWAHLFPIKQDVVCSVFNYVVMNMTRIINLSQIGCSFGRVACGVVMVIIVAHNVAVSVFHLGEIPSDDIIVKILQGTNIAVIAVAIDGFAVIIYRTVLVGHFPIIAFGSVAITHDFLETAFNTHIESLRTLIAVRPFSLVRQWLHKSCRISIDQLLPIKHIYFTFFPIVKPWHTPACVNGNARHRKVPSFSHPTASAVVVVGNRKLRLHTGTPIGNVNRIRKVRTAHIVCRWGGNDRYPGQRIGAFEVVHHSRHKSRRLRHLGRLDNGVNEICEVIHLRHDTLSVEINLVEFHLTPGPFRLIIIIGANIGRGTTGRNQQTVVGKHDGDVLAETCTVRQHSETAMLACDVYHTHV